jgi:hypothetical protein
MAAISLRYNLWIVSDPVVYALQGKLDAVLVKLKQTKDPFTGRSLLAEMRSLMAELDRHVLDPHRLNAARPEPPK